MLSGIALAGLALSAQSTPDTMPANSWLTAPNTKMRSVAPANGQFPGTWGIVGPNSVIIAWGGAALDTRRSRLVLWGGGHADYYGNELYTFDVATLQWARITDPFVNPVMDQEVNADGTPNSRHTYGGLAYIAHADRFLGQGGSLAGSGFARCDRTWTFDFATKTWSNRNPPTTSGGGFGCSATYDPASRQLWWGSAAGSFAGLWSYDYDANAWAKRNSDNFSEHMSALDTKRGLLVFVGGGEVFAYDVRNANFTRQPWTTTGGGPFIAKKAVGLDYDPVADRIVGWHGGAVYVLDPVSKAWTAYAPPGAPPTTSQGIYGRWRYVPSVNAFVLVTDWDRDVSFYKLTAGGGTLPPPPPPPSGDTDGDGLPDAWEQQYFGDLNQAGGGDPDGDGATNAQEYAAGTDPTAAPPPSGGGTPALPPESEGEEGLCGALGVESIALVVLARILGLLLRRR
jgi:hypothetical protein